MSNFKVQVVENVATLSFDASLTTRSGQIFYGKGRTKQEAHDAAIKAFADAVREKNAKEKNATFDFGEAVRKLKEGNRVMRAGWNGKGMFLYYVPAASYPMQRNSLETMGGIFPDDMVPYGAYIAMKTAQDNVVPWLASQTDVLAEDWQLA